MSRQRVRELSDQARETKSMNRSPLPPTLLTIPALLRFLSKHSPAPVSSSATSRTPNRSHRPSAHTTPESDTTYIARYLEGIPGNFSENSIKLHQSLNHSNLFSPPDALSGVAGLSNAIVSLPLLPLSLTHYPPPPPQYLREEEMEPVSHSLEQSLLSLHDSIALTAPSLLPMIQKLGSELRNERTQSHRQKIDLLAKFLNGSGSDPSASASRGGAGAGGRGGTPLKSKSTRNKSPSEMRGRALVRPQLLQHHHQHHLQQPQDQYQPQERSRSRSAGSVGEVSVSSHSSYRTARSFEGSRSSGNGSGSYGASSRSPSGSGGGSSAAKRMVFFRRENDV
jgi:hypothetical protein